MTNKRVYSLYLLSGRPESIQKVDVAEM